MEKKFSYFDLLNRFWRLDAVKPFSALDTRYCGPNEAMANKDTPVP